MNTEELVPACADDIGELRNESRTAISLFCWAAGLLWLWWALPPRKGGAPPPAAWAGIALLLLGTSLGAILSKRHKALASSLLTYSILGSATCALLTFSLPTAAYLLIVPVLFASVLLSSSAFLAASVIAVFLVPFAYLWRAEVSVGNVVSTLSSLSAAGVAAPTAILLLVIGTSWLSARGRSTALAWSWHALESSRESEWLARDHQAKLARTLKALDEATYRIERANYALTLARNEAEEARRLKQQFAQTVSHELRTPLNVITGFTEMMIDTPDHYGSQLPVPCLRDLNIVNRNACHLQTLVSDVLDLARIDAAQMALVPEEVDPAALLTDAVTTARSLVEASGLKLRVNTEEDLPTLWVDPTRIRQVLFNLLNNARRFTETGSVTVGIRRDDDGDGVIFFVKDTGIGIAPQDLHHIFEEFRQADASTHTHHGGVGLGLAISRRFVELHGGHIWVDSQVGEGSTFYFKLPRDGLARSDSSAVGPQASWQRQSSSGREEPVLLAVTRSPFAAKLLSRYVLGCRTVVASDLAQAKALAHQLTPQGVVIDNALGFEGSVLPSTLAREWDLPRTTFVCCPLPGEDRFRQQLAVDGFLSKPISRRGLLDVLRGQGQDINRVLLIDDDRDFVLLLERMLETETVRRYHVFSALTGNEGLEIAGRLRPDLILLDLGLPDVPGSEVIAELRAKPESASIPIVVISGQDAQDETGTLPGQITVSRLNGLSPAEVVRWIQGVMTPGLLAEMK